MSKYLDNPQDIDLPYYAYGNFTFGNLGYLSIKPYVDHQEDFYVPGRLYQREGLILFEYQNNFPDEIKGSLIHFKETDKKNAYNVISRVEPRLSYRWVKTSKDNITFNFLEGLLLNRGAYVIDENSWSGIKDPTFTTALDVIEDMITNLNDYEEKSLFKAHMAYSLLWTVMERYFLLRYGAGSKNGRVNLAKDPVFIKKLKELINPNHERKLYKADRLDRTDIFLNVNNPTKAIEYYWEIRNNAVHRGKAAMGEDFPKIAPALKELFEIFKACLKNAFEEASQTESKK